MRTSFLVSLSLVVLIGCEEYDRYSPEELADDDTSPNLGQPGTTGLSDNDDQDGDGFANQAAGGTDCDDGDPSINPGAADETCNGIDDNCLDGDADESQYRSASPCGGADDDGDHRMTTYTDSAGVIHPYDCNDHDVTIYPDAPETCNGIDNDCSGAIDDKDVDFDGFVDQACAATHNGSLPETDCDDTREAVHPGVTEVANNGLDDDCNSATSDGGVVGQDDLDCDGATVHDDCNDNNRDLNLQDNDGDGWNTCELDCDDSAVTGVHTFPGVAERNSLTACERDNDGDGYGMSSPPIGITAGTDCDDTRAGVKPGAVEIAGNGLDDDCNPATSDGGGGLYTHYVDSDRDGHGTSAFIQDSNSAAPAGYVNTVHDDCNDNSSTVHPGAMEVYYNNVDEDCDGLGDDDDADTDGYNATVSGGTDCDDTRSTVHPGAPEVANNGRDDDCNAATPDVPAGSQVTLTVMADNVVLTGATPSWELWGWNVTAGDGNWPGITTPVYCGTTVNNTTIVCNIDRHANDLVWLNGAWDQGRRWLGENNGSGGLTSNIDEVRFAGVLYPVSLLDNANPAAGTCAKKPGSYDLVCKLL